MEEQKIVIPKKDDDTKGAESKKYHGFCSKCNYSWDSETKPEECPECGNEGIVIS